MSTIVTGASGQLGKEVVKQLSDRGCKNVYAFNSHEMDITDYDAVCSIVNKLKPDVVYNCAAHTKVDLCESDRDNAYLTNAIGPRNLALACQIANTEVVHISTDYVFDGKAKEPMKEDAPVAPNTVYGKSKLMGEQMLNQFCPQNYIIRTAWLYGDGENFVHTMLSLGSKNKKIKVVEDQIGTPTSVREVAKTMIMLTNSGKYGLYHGTCLGSCSWFEFAKKIFELKGMDIEIEPVTSDTFPRPAKRPAYSVLDNFMLRIQGMDTFQSWEDALREFIKDMK